MRILIVEDAVKLASSLKRGLETEGYAVDVLHDGLAARRRFAARRGEPGGPGDPDDLPYDLILLDVLLPGVDGFTLCRELRDWGFTVPVLMLTARDAIEDRVTGLDGGADDYLVKPFAFDELLARIRTLLRRPRHVLPPAIVAGDVTLDPARHEASVDGAPLELSTKESAVLELFLRHPGEVLTRGRILDHAWDEEFDSFSNIVDVYVGRLRRKLSDHGSSLRLETVRGRGYLLREPGARPGKPGRRDAGGHEQGTDGGSTS